MKRFNIFNADVVENHDGQWVKYDEAQSRIKELEKALKPVKESIDHIDHADGSNWDDPSWNENYTVNIGLRVSEIRLIIKALRNDE